MNSTHYIPTDGTLASATSCYARDYIDVGHYSRNDSFLSLIDDEEVIPEYMYTLASGGDENITLWTMLGSAPLRTLESHSAWVRCLLTLPDGRLVSSGVDTTIRIWNPHTDVCDFIFCGHTRGVNSITFLQNSDHIISVSNDKTLKIWSLQQQAGREHKNNEEKEEWVHSMKIYAKSCIALPPIQGRQLIAISPMFEEDIAIHDVSSFIVDNSSYNSGNEDQKMDVANLNLDDGTNPNPTTLTNESQLIQNIQPFSLVGHQGQIFSFSIVFIGEEQQETQSHTAVPFFLLASGSFDTTIRLWDVQSRRCVSVLEGHDGTVSAITSYHSKCSGETHIASGGAAKDPRILIWNVVVDATHESSESEVDSNDDVTAYIVTAECQLILEGHTDEISQLVLLPDKNLASSSYDKTIRVWNVSTSGDEVEQKQRCIRVFTASSVVGCLAVISSLVPLIDASEIENGPVIGRGHYGVVRRGRYRNIEVVIKKLLRDDSGRSVSSGVFSPAQKKQFFMECLLLQQASKHPNVPSFFGALFAPREASTSSLLSSSSSLLIDHKQENNNMPENLVHSPSLPPPPSDSLSLVMEYLPGGSLEGVISSSSEQDRSNFSWIVAMAVDAASAVSHLHSLGLVHRDLAARNFMLDRNGRVCIGDFGLSLLSKRDSSNVEESLDVSTFGPVKWWPPEALSMSRIFSYKSDVWSFGVVLYEMVTGLPPFPSLTNTEAVSAIRSGSFPAVPESIPCHDGYRMIMQQCFMVDPRKRPTMQQVKGALLSLYRDLKSEEEEKKTSDDQVMLSSIYAWLTKPKLVAAGFHHGFINVWGLSTAEKHLVLKGSNNRISSMLVKDDSTLVATSHDQQIHVFDIHTGERRIYFTQEAQLGGLSCVLYLPEYDLYAIGSHAMNIAIYKLDIPLSGSGAANETGVAQCKCVLTGHLGAVWCIARVFRGNTSVSGDNCVYIASGSSDTKVRIWNVSAAILAEEKRQEEKEERQVSNEQQEEEQEESLENFCVATLIGHTGEIHNLLWTGSSLVSASYDGTCRVWSEKEDSWTCSRIIHVSDCRVTALTLLSDGLLATGSQDFCIRIYNLENGECTQVLQNLITDKSGQRQSGVVSCLCGLPDGRLLSGSAYDKTLMSVWNLQTGECELKLSQPGELAVFSMSVLRDSW